MENKKTFFERYILPVLKYIGIIGATLMSIAYIALVIVLVEGFEQHELKGDIIFGIVNAGVGLIIMMFLKIQGISFAKSLPENKEVLNEYYNTKTKDKKPHSIKFYWLTSTLKDVLIKAISIAATTIGIIYIVIEGSHDYMLLLLAGVNLILFICFGLLSLNQAYEYYCNKHIPFIKEQLNNRKNKEENQDVQTRRQDLQKSRRTSSRKQGKHSISIRARNGSKSVWD